MPAYASLSIPAIADQLAGVELPDPVVLAPALIVVLATVADPRKARGLRHRLVVLLTVAVCAVAAGRGRSSRSANGSLTCPDRWPKHSAPANGVPASPQSAAPCVTSTLRLSTPRSAGSSNKSAPRWPRLGDVGCSQWTANPARIATHRPRRDRGHGPASARGDRPARSRCPRPGRRRDQDQRDHRVHTAARHPDQH